MGRCISYQQTGQEYTVSLGKNNFRCSPFLSKKALSPFSSWHLLRPTGRPTKGTRVSVSILFDTFHSYSLALNVIYSLLQRNEQWENAGRDNEEKKKVEKKGGIDARIACAKMRGGKCVEDVARTERSRVDKKTGDRKIDKGNRTGIFPMLAIVENMTVYVKCEQRHEETLFYFYFFFFCFNFINHSTK